MKLRRTMTDDLKTLPPKEKRVASKVLINEGYSTREVEEILGVDHSSVSRYAKQDTPEELQQFETKLINIFRQTEHRIAAKALRRLESTIDRARINEALEVYKEMKGKTAGNDNPNLKKRIVAEEFFS